MKIVMLIHSHPDGTTSLSSMPDVGALATQVVEGDAPNSGAITYAHRVVNHLHQFKDAVIQSVKDQRVIITIEDTPRGVSVLFEPKFSEIYQASRDNVTPLSRAYYLALEAKAAIMMLHRVLNTGQLPTRIGA